VTELLNRVRLTVEGEVAQITLIRGAGNALDSDMGTAFLGAVRQLTEAVEHGRVRVAVLAAEGTTWCVGGDLKHFAEADDPGARVAGVAEDLHSAILQLRDLPIPVVTVVHGTLAGGGIGLALAGDIVIMAAEAILKLAYTAAGLSPDCGATWFLTTRIGEARTLDLALLNRTLTGAEAAEWGLISRAVPRAELAETAAIVVAGLSTGSREAYARTKALINGGSRAALADRLDEEARNISEAINRPDGREGIAAFLGKRAADFD
jgi:2-(1,2-epoxy-1,2-dihydrophenyl)acetyl-CoA isomerase